MIRGRGVLPTPKHLAKVASRSAKPDGLVLVPPDEEVAFLHPLPVERLWGVGAVTAAKLHGRGIHTVAELAALDPALLDTVVGRAAGRHLHALANLRDPRPVEHRRRRRSIGSQRAFGSRTQALAVADAHLAGLVDRVARRLRRAERIGRTVVLRVRFADFGRITRSHTLAGPTSDTSTILLVARHLLRDAAPLVRERGLTLVGVAVTNLDDADHVQLALPFGRRDRSALDLALDGVRDRYGAAAITRAVLVGRDPGIAVPLLPD